MTLWRLSPLLLPALPLLVPSALFGPRFGFFTLRGDLDLSDAPVDLPPWPPKRASMAGSSSSSFQNSVACADARMTLFHSGAYAESAGLAAWKSTRRRNSWTHHSDRHLWSASAQMAHDQLYFATRALNLAAKVSNTAGVATPAMMAAVRNTRQARSQASTLSGPWSSFVRNTPLPSKNWCVKRSCLAIRFPKGPTRRSQRRAAPRPRPLAPVPRAVRP